MSDMTEQLIVRCANTDCHAMMVWQRIHETQPFTECCGQKAVVQLETWRDGNWSGDTYNGGGAT